MRTTCSANSPSLWLTPSHGGGDGGRERGELEVPFLLVPVPSPEQGKQDVDGRPQDRETRTKRLWPSVRLMSAMLGPGDGD